MVDERGPGARRGQRRHGSAGRAPRRRRGGRTVRVAPSAATAVLPPLAPGPGRAANVPTASLVAALRSASGAGLRADLVDHGATAGRGRPARADAARSAVEGSGRSGRRGPVGISAPLPEVLGVLDGPRGRYLTTRSRSDDGADWTTVAPTDDRRLRHRVTALLAQAASDR